MIASRYGTVAVVRETGGLKDSHQGLHAGEGKRLYLQGLPAEELKKRGKAGDFPLPGPKDDWKNLMGRGHGDGLFLGRSAGRYFAMYEALLRGIE